MTIPSFEQLLHFTCYVGILVVLFCLLVVPPWLVYMVFKITRGNK